MWASRREARYRRAGDQGDRGGSDAELQGLEKIVLGRYHRVTQLFYLGELTLIVGCDRSLQCFGQGERDTWHL